MDLMEKEVYNYYNQCDKAFDILWRDKKNLGMHFGYWYPNTKSHAEAMENQNKALAKLANIKKSDKILDAGCGVGGSSFWLANNYKVNVEGININDKQIKLALKKAKELNLVKQVKFSVQNYHSTNFPNNYFDIVWSQESLPHSNNKENFLKEAYRVLKPGGRLIVAEYFREKDKYTEREEKVMTKFVGGWAMAPFKHPKEFKRYVAKAGFKNIKYLNTTKMVGPEMDRLSRAYYAFYPIAIVFRMIRLKSLGNHIETNNKNYESALYSKKTFKDKLWGTGTVYAEK